MKAYCLSFSKYTARVRKIKYNRSMLLPKYVICSKRKSTFIKNVLNDQFKMIKIINKFLSIGDKFMSEFHLKQPRFTCSGSRTFAKIYL